MRLERDSHKAIKPTDTAPLEIVAKDEKRRGTLLISTSHSLHLSPLSAPREHASVQNRRHPRSNNYQITADIHSNEQNYGVRGLAFPLGLARKILPNSVIAFVTLQGPISRNGAEIRSLEPRSASIGKHPRAFTGKCSSLRDWTEMHCMSLIDAPCI